MSKTSNASAQKSGFGTKIGFVLAAAGSAVGLGNIWRFPYLAAKYGGGIFLLIYLILAVTFGFSLMITETAIGRKTGKSVIGAYSTINKKFTPLGWLAAAVPVIILPYYCVIGGWVLKYMCVYFTGGGAEAATATYATSDPEVTLSYFENFIGHAGQPTIFFLIYVILTAVVVMLGVEKGIEKVSKFMMPVLIFITVAIAIYTLTLDGAGEGVRYYLLPDFEGFTFKKLLSTIAAAMGQLFYSMSLAMGIMITYGSYMRKEDSLESSVRQIEIFDTAVAFLSGLIIVPAVFVFSGGDKDALNAGAGLMFITLPKVFESMAGGQFIGAAFFVLVALAALTSSISLMETVVSIISEKFKLKRTPSCLIVIAITLIIGMLSVFGYSIWSDFTLTINEQHKNMSVLDIFDFFSNNIFMPIVALLTCILIGYIVKTKYVEDEILISQKNFKSKGLYRVMVKYICPVCMVVILITSIFVSF